MKVIYKYKLEWRELQHISLPFGYQFLKAVVQYEYIVFWALVEPDNKKDDVLIEFFGTGHPIDDQDRLYLDTVIDGDYVWHIFIRLK